jgi:hypothetical protein
MKKGLRRPRNENGSHSSLSQQTKGLSRRHGGGFYFAWTISVAAG